MLKRIGVGLVFSLFTTIYYVIILACKPFSYIDKSVLFLIILIVFIILAKCYKLRVRENEINIHLIAEEHYERYMDQEAEYNNEIGYSLEYTN